MEMHLDANYLQVMEYCPVCRALMEPRVTEPKITMVEGDFGAPSSQPGVTTNAEPGKAMVVDAEQLFYCPNCRRTYRWEDLIENRADEWKSTWKGD